MIVLGILILLGTVGASDLDIINFGQILIQSGIGITLILLGVIVWHRKRILKTKSKRFSKIKVAGH